MDAAVMPQGAGGVYGVCGGLFVDVAHHVLGDAVAHRPQLRQHRLERGGDSGERTHHLRQAMRKLVRRIACRR